MHSTKYKEGRALFRTTSASGSGMGDYRLLMKFLRHESCFLLALTQVSICELKLRLASGKVDERVGV